MWAVPDHEASSLDQESKRGQNFDERAEAKV